MTKPPLNHMMLHEDTLADEFDAILGYRTSHAGIVLPGGFTSQGNRMLIIGDSIAGQHGYTLPITSLTLDGSTTMTVSWTSHNCIPGSRVYGFRATDEALNGHFEVATVTDANTFTVTLPAAASGTVTAKAGGLIAIRQNVLTDIGSMNWLTCLNDACFDIVGVCAEGASLTTYLATLVANANSAGLEYDWVTIISGINDAASWASTPADGSAEALVANITAVADDLRAAGKGVIISTIGPWGAAHASYSADRYTEVQAANTLLRAYIAATDGVFLMDAYEAGSTAGVPDSNILSDNLHPTQLGAYTYAKQFMADNPGVLPAPVALPTSSAGQDYYVDSGVRQFWKNPMFLGSGGVDTSVANTGVTTGTIPADQWLGAFGSDAGGVAALASSLVAAASGNGNAIQADWTGEDNNDGVYLRLTDLYPEALVAGEYLQAIVRLRVEATGGGAPTQMGRNDLWVQANIGAGTRTIMAMLYNASQPAAAAYPQFTEQLTLITPKHRFPSLTGLTQVQPYVQCNTKTTCFNSYFIENPALWATTE